MKIDLNRPLTPRDNPTVVIPLHELQALEALAARRLKSVNAWKQVAKQWRDWGNVYYEAYKEASTDRFELGMKWSLACALAADRLKLLRRIEQNARYCVICNWTDKHGDDCELDKALVSEQSEEELGDG